MIRVFSAGRFSGVLLSAWSRYLLVAICLLSWVEVYADPTPLPDYQVKAAMIYKFLGYVDWPEGTFAAPDSPYRLCVLGSDLMADELQTLVRERQIAGRGIEICRANNLSELTGSQLPEPQLIFVARDMERLLPSLAQAARQHSYLLVTESENGLRAGSIINLRLIDGRIGFDISLASAQKSRLKLSSRLLAVAATVEGERQ